MELEKREITPENLTPEERTKVDQIRNSISLDDSQAIIQYGVGAQSQIAQFSDTILSEVKSKDSGYVGEMLTDLMINVKDLKVDKLASGGGFLAKMPIIGNMVNSVKRFIAQYEKVGTHIERITDELSKARMQLLKDITMLDQLYEKNLQYVEELDMYILAGEEKLKELQEEVLPKMKQEAEASGDPVDAQRVQDMSQLINRFEKKIHDLKLSRMVAIQTSPQVRMVQNNDQLLVEKIQSSILNTIPLWKNQVVIAISLFKQQKAVELQKEVSKTTNDLLSKNSELLKQNSLEVARESEKGIVEIETLKKVNNDLITTIDETLKIQAEGRAKRREAEVELLRLEEELKQKLVQSKEAGLDLGK